MAQFLKISKLQLCRNIIGINKITIHRRYASKKKDETKKEFPYIIQLATKEDHQCIIDLMWNSFYPDEPTTAGLGLGKKYNAVLEEHALHMLSEGVSLVAKCKYNGNIMGACINASTSPWDPDLLERFACNVACPETRQLLMFWAHLERAPDIWRRLCTQKVFELACLVVKKRERGKGLALKLSKASKEFGLDCGYNVIRVDATSYYTAKICEKLKFKLLHEIPYCSYIGPNQKPVIKTEPPHTSAKVYVYATHLNLKK